MLLLCFSSIKMLLYLVYNCYASWLVKMFGTFYQVFVFIHRQRSTVKADCKISANLNVYKTMYLLLQNM